MKTKLKTNNSKPTLEALIFEGLLHDEIYYEVAKLVIAKVVMLLSCQCQLIYTLILAILYFQLCMTGIRIGILLQFLWSRDLYR